MSRSKKIFLVAVVGLASIGAYIALRAPGKVTSEVPSTTQQRELSQVAGSTAGVQTFPAAAPSPVPPKVDLQERYGPGLQVRFSEMGLLESIEAVQKVPGSLKKAPGYRSDNEKDVIARAWEILRDTQHLLGPGVLGQVGEPRVKNDDVTARARFQQEIGGAEVVPGGAITVQLGPGGELFGLYSEFIPGIVLGERPKNPGSGLVIWVEGRGAGTKGVYAYQTHEKGSKVVRDAKTGEVLFKKDERHR